MSLADELSGAFGGGGGSGGGRKRRAASRRQQQYISDDEQDDHLTLAPANHATSIAGEIEAAASQQQKQHAAAHLQDSPSQSGLQHEDLAAGDPSLDSPTPPPGSAEAQFIQQTSQACAQLLEVVASTNIFLQHLRTTTDVQAISSSASTTTPFPTSATISNFNLAKSASGAAGTADDTARLEAYAAYLLRTMREQAKQREQYVRDLREVDRHMARAETTDPEFLAKLGEADERLEFEADEAEAEAQQQGDQHGDHDEEDQAQTRTWAEAQARRRQGSTASADTEKPHLPSSSVAPRFRPEVITSEVTDALTSILQRSPNDVVVDAGKDGSDHGHAYEDDDDDDDDYDARDTTTGSSRADRSYDDHDDEDGDELGPGWDDPARAQRGSAPAGALADISVASTNGGGGGGNNPSGAASAATLPSLRTAGTMLMHHFSSVHETAQVAGAILATHDRRLRTLRHLLEGWKEEIVAARRSRAWIAKWEGREPERDDLYLDEDEENSGKLDDVLAKTLATVAAGAGAGGGKYTAGSGITPGAYAQEQMSRFQSLLAEAEERAQALLSPLPLPSVGAAAA
ncbi:hypothetical protein OC861_000584 [Tilletia horrida]|nr:hypothetical protein OC861_000584 [Tilletia horrida]